MKWFAIGVICSVLSCILCLETSNLFQIVDFNYEIVEEEFENDKI